MNMLMPKEINSKEYWDFRFQEDWEEKNGKQQTETFYKILLKNLPDFIKNFVQKNTETINDVGCAMGEGTSLLQKSFKTQTVTGSDFSQTAINKAKTNYPNLNFEVQDVLTSRKQYDVIIASNVIEHFPKPLNVLAKILSNTKQIAIIMIPFQEDKNDMANEHYKSFDFQDFNIIFDDFVLIYSKEMNLKGTKEASSWNGRQLILIYGKKYLFPLENLSLKDYISSRSIEELAQYQKEVKHLMQKTKELSTEKDKLTSEVEKLYKDVKDKTNILNEIYSSKMWEITSAYHIFLKKHPSLRKIIGRTRLSKR